jgi:hypothetical protein|tara:strand:+ start:277 stop:720 length:444 start_codon:yes stop_codon:yes gene_type:complete
MFFFKSLIKSIPFLSDYISKFFLLNNNKFNKSEILFDTIQYKSDYNSDSFLFIFLPLIINISQILNDIKKQIDNKKLISITSTIIFYEKENNNEYTHSLVDSNQLYSLNNINEWPNILMLNIINKLEVYNSFKKISIITLVKTVTKI